MTKTRAYFRLLGRICEAIADMPEDYSAQTVMSFFSEGTTLIWGVKDRAMAVRALFDGRYSMDFSAADLVYDAATRPPEFGCPWPEQRFGRFDKNQLCLAVAWALYRDTPVVQTKDE